jgi:hypothetical protein
MYETAQGEPLKTSAGPIVKPAYAVLGAHVRRIAAKAAIVVMLRICLLFIDSSIVLELFNIILIYEYHNNSIYNRYVIYGVE